MRQGIQAVRLPRVHRVTKGGKVYRWHRPTRIKLPDDIPETHPDFIAAWAAAESMSAKPSRAAGGSIAAEIDRLIASSGYRAYSKVYRHEISREAGEIRAEYGEAKIAGLRVQHIKADLSRLAPRKANARLKVWRLICKGAEARGAISADPSKGIAKIRVATSGYAAWSADDVAAFRAKHPIGTVARACFELVFWTGARTVDAVAIGRQHVGADGLLTFRQSKTGGRAYVPWSSALPDFARAWSAEREGVHAAIACLAGGLTFLQAQGGRARSVKGLGGVISAAAVAAGLDGRTAHGLRKSRLTMIAEAGGSAHAIMAWGGHKTLAEAQRYTSEAQIKRLVLGTERIQNEVNLPVNREK